MQSVADWKNEGIYECLFQVLGSFRTPFDLRLIDPVTPSLRYFEPFLPPSPHRPPGSFGLGRSMISLAWSTPTLSCGSPSRDEWAVSPSLNPRSYILYKKFRSTIQNCLLVYCTEVHLHSTKFNNLLESNHRPATKDPTIGRVRLIFFFLWIGNQCSQQGKDFLLVFCFPDKTR